MSAKPPASARVTTRRSSHGPRHLTISLGPIAMLAWRRARRDAWMVLASVAVVAMSAVLAYAGPLAVVGTLDEGAADAVRTAGASANLTVAVPVGNPSGDNVSSLRGLDPESFGTAVEAMTGQLPKPLAAVLGEPKQWSVSASQQLEAVTTKRAIDIAAEDQTVAVPTERGDANIFLGYVPGASMTIAQGVAPVYDSSQGPAAANMPDPQPIQVALTEPVATALGVGIGDVLDIRHVGQDPVQLVVTGIGSLDDPRGIAAQALPTLTAPETFFEGTAQERVDTGVLLTADAAAGFTALTKTPIDGTVVWPAIPDALTMDLARQIPRSIETLTESSEALLPEGQVTPQPSTRLGDVLADYPTRARAALSQMSVLIAGVVAAASAVVLLMARLLLAGREKDIALERARGGSITATASALALEATVVTALGIGIGYGLAVLLADASDPFDPLVGIVAAVAVIAPTLLGVAKARAMWAGRREGANRTDRAKAASARRASALTRDALVVIVAVLAVGALRGRGLTQTTSTSVDPFLASGPVIVTLAVTLIVLRLVPGPMRLAQLVAARTRGTAGLLALSRARQRVAALPVLALSLAIGVAASGSLLTTTVTQGQEAASWERVGAQARIQGTLSDEVTDELTAGGLDVAPLLLAPYSTISIGKNLDTATIMAVSPEYATILDEAGYHDQAATIRGILDASEGLGDGQALPALASGEVRAKDVYDSTELFAGKTYIPFTITADAINAPQGWSEGPYVIVSLDALLSLDTQEPIVATHTLIGGQQAAEILTQSLPQDSPVITRQGWLDAARGSALIGGVQRVMFAAVGAVALLAAVSLLVGVVTGSKERSRALALLRTQGVKAGYGWWLAAVDLGPAVGAASFAGAAGAAVVVLTLSASLGLDVLAGGIGQPDLSFDPTHLLLGVAGIVALSLVAVLAEVYAQSRAKLSEVLRYGETR